VLQQKELLAQGLEHIKMLKETKLDIKNYDNGEENLLKLIR